jgi:hypothetical protein
MSFPLASLRTFLDFDYLEPVFSIEGDKAIDFLDILVGVDIIVKQI